MKRSYAFLLLLGLGALSVGCGGAASDYCDQVCDCEGCSDKDYDKCVADFEYMEDVAEAYDCSDDFDSAVDCVIEHNDCVADEFVYGASCADEGADLAECEDDGSDL